MATFELTGPEGGTYHVDAPDEHAAIAAFSAFHGSKTQDSAPPPDKYQQAAIDEYKSNPALESQTGYTRRLVHGYTLGADNTLAAGAFTPLEMIRHGTMDPREGYNYAKAREDLILNKARENTGALGTAAEVLGGGVSGAGLASGGVTTARFLAPEAGLLARSAASAVDAGVLGGFSGAMEGNGFKERFNNAVKGMAAGAALGGLTPGALKIAGAAASPVVSNFRARMNPQGFAESQIARGIHESGVNPDQLSLDTVQAGNEGQPQFTLADAMGNAGQRLLSTVARAPGEGRTAVVNALESRQAGQGRRVASALAEGFDSPQTAAQTEARLTGARDTRANAEYGAVRHDAEPVDVSGAIANIDQTLAPYGVPRDVSANDTAAAALAKYRARLTDGRGTNNDFNAVQRVRGDLSDEIQQARQSGAGNKARLLGGLLRELDTSLETSSSGFRQANRNFAQASRDIEAVQQGRDASMRGRTEDTIPAFRNLEPQGQQAFRSGYVDPLISQAQGAAFGANKARPLINDAFQAEAGVMAPGNPMMQRRLAREQTMFETRNHALGGSRTADNLNDHAAMGIDPHLVGQIVTGNWHGAMRTALSAGHSALSGNTPAVRQEVANILLRNGQNISSANLRRMVNETVARIQFVQNIARNVGRGAAGGLAIAVPGTQRRQ